MEERVAGELTGQIANTESSALNDPVYRRVIHSSIVCNQQ